MSARVIAQLLATGGAILFRASIQAYQQAIINGKKAGGAEALKQATGRSGSMTLSEARKILGLEATCSQLELEKKYKHLYEANEGVSHYLTSKVYRAKECIDNEAPPPPVPKAIDGEETPKT